MNNNNIITLGWIPKTENGGDGKAHQSNMVYDINGVSPCISAMFMVKQPPTMILVEVKNG